MISLQNLDREYAFSEGDVRLLSTLAASLSVALENARLFDETKRLLAETDERAAELAIINGVQQGLAAQLDMQAMYDLVGDKIREVFDAQVVDIGILDADDGLSASRTRSSAACASPTSRSTSSGSGARSSRPGRRSSSTATWSARPRRPGSRRSSRASCRSRRCSSR